jgi:hypothetical protein
MASEKTVSQDIFACQPRGRSRTVERHDPRHSNDSCRSLYSLPDVNYKPIRNCNDGLCVLPYLPNGEVPTCQCDIEQSIRISHL